MENENNPQVHFTTPEVTRVTPDSVTVAWSCEIEGVLEDSVSFEVFVKGEMADGSPFDRVEAPERNTCTITGLKEDTTYSVFVVAVHEGEDVTQVPDTDDGIVVTTPKNTPPAKTDWKKIAIIAGSCLAAIALGVLLYFLLRDSNPPVIDQPKVSANAQDNLIALTWHPAKDDNTAPGDIRYQVARTDESGNWMEPQVVQGDTVFTFTDLKARSTYHFRIEALDKAGNSCAYEELSMGTTDTTPPYVDDKTVTASDITQDSFTLTWNPATDNATPHERILYRVYLKDEFSRAYDLLTSGFGITSCSATGLDPGENYMFYLEAYDESGNMLEYSRERYHAFYATTLKKEPKEATE